MCRQWKRIDYFDRNYTRLYWLQSAIRPAKPVKFETQRSLLSFQVNKVATLATPVPVRDGFQWQRGTTGHAYTHTTVYDHYHSITVTSATAGFLWKELQAEEAPERGNAETNIVEQSWDVKRGDPSTSVASTNCQLASQFSYAIYWSTSDPT